MTQRALTGAQHKALRRAKVAPLWEYGSKWGEWSIAADIAATTIESLAARSLLVIEKIGSGRRATFVDPEARTGA